MDTRSYNKLFLPSCTYTSWIQLSNNPNPSPNTCTLMAWINYYSNLDPGRAGIASQTRYTICSFLDKASSWTWRWWKLSWRVWRSLWMLKWAMIPRNDLLVVSNHVCPHGLSLCCISGFFRNIYGLLQGYRWNKTLDIEPEEIQDGGLNWSTEKIEFTGHFLTWIPPKKSAKTTPFTPKSTFNFRFMARSVTKRSKLYFLGRRTGILGVFSSFLFCVCLNSGAP